MSPAPPTDETAAPATARRGRRWPLALALAITALPAVALLSAWWLARSETGTRWLLAQVPGLQASGVQGSLLGDALAIESLHWQGTPQQGRLEIAKLQWSQPQWRVGPHAGAWIGLSLAQAKAARVQWHSPVQPSPAAAPAHLRLPFELQVGSAQLDELLVDDVSLRQLAARVHLGADGGARHRVDDAALQLDRAEVRGRAEIAADAPMALALEAQARSTQGRPWQATLQASGPLAGFDVQARLRGEALAAGASAPRLDAKARVEPFAAWPLAALEASTQDLDLAALATDAPHTRLRGDAHVRSAGLDKPALVSLQLDNALPGRWDNARVPLSQLALALRGTPNRLDRLEIERLDAHLADERGSAGRVQGSGRWEAARLQLQLQLQALQPGRLDARAGALDLNGPLALDLTGVPVPTQRNAPAPAAPWRAQVQADLAGTVGTGRVPVTVSFAGHGAADELELTRWLARSGDASASGRARLQRGADARQREWSLRGDGTLARFDPRMWWPGAAGSAWARGAHRFDGRWQADLRVPERIADLARRDVLGAVRSVRGKATLTLDDSLLAGVPVAGTLQLDGDSARLALQGRARAAGNDFELQGQLADRAGDDRWQLDAQASALAELRPLLQLLGEDAAAAAADLRGELHGRAEASGRWPALATQGQARVRGLAWRQLRLEQAEAQWRLEPGDDGALQLQTTLSRLQQGEQRIDALQARVDGTRRDHKLAFQVDSPLRPPAWAEPLLGSTAGGMRVAVEGQGRWLAQADGTSVWRTPQAALRIGARDGASAAWLDARELQGEVQLDERTRPLRAQLAPGRALLPGGAALRWSDAAWRSGIGGADQLRLRGQLEPLSVAPVLARLQPDLGWAGDLTLAGRVELNAEQRVEAEIVVERVGGDLRIEDESGAPQPLGLTDLRLAFAAKDGVWQFAQGAAGKQLGEMAGSQVLRTRADARWPPADAPLEGVMEVRVANLGAWGVWVPPGWRLGGSLQLSGALGGRFGAPEVRGSLRGSSLSVRNTLQGVGVSDGELEATLEGAVARVQRFEFKGGDGQLRLTGEAALGDNPSAQLRLQAERFRVLGRIDRKLVASGQAQMQLTREALKLDGAFKVDEGFIDFSRGDAPSLDGDVHVARPAGAASAPGTERRQRQASAPLRNAQVALAIDLGDKLQVRGRGLDATLRGQLRLTNPEGRPAVNGSVRTASGTYVAYAQKMSIERGELAFSGAADNPRLDIIAVRPNLDVRVGVAVTGTLANPRVRLFSEPEMTEMDKLSWLVLGRASDGLGRADTALLQRAAMALLAGEEASPTDKLLGELGISDFSLRQSEGDTRETIVSVGRQLTQRWYLGYERSVNATTGTWQLIYRAAQRFTLRAQSGMENSLDVIWSWRWN
ncbi:MAG: translocation/assembly module TamB domain-containing protein [Burkholderiaceae bacterium]